MKNHHQTQQNHHQNQCIYTSKLMQKKKPSPDLIERVKNLFF